MNRNLSSVFLVCLLSSIFLPAFAENFAVGQRVWVGSMNEKGSILQIGNPTHDGVQVKVHLDRFGNENQTMGVWYDSALSHLTLDTDPAPAAVSGGNGRAAANAAQSGGTVPITIDNSAAGTPELFKKLITKHYTDMAQPDQTITVTFKTFDVGTPRQAEAVYKNTNMLGARGHSYNSWPVHATYTVHTHFASPMADDIDRDYGIDWLCYKTGNEWIASQSGQFLQPGWPRYVKKH